MQPAQVKVLQPEQAIRRTKKSQTDGQVYNVVDSYVKDLTGTKMLVLQNPIDPEDLVTIAEKFVEYLREAVEIWEEDVKPTLEKAQGFFARAWAWVKNIFK
jgi:hypothetical protein